MTNDRFNIAVRFDGKDVVFDGPVGTWAQCDQAFDCWVEIAERNSLVAQVGIFHEDGWFTGRSWSREHEGKNSA